jgi:hypothetical protein
MTVVFLSYTTPDVPIRAFSIRPLFFQLLPRRRFTLPLLSEVVRNLSQRPLFFLKILIPRGSLDNDFARISFIIHAVIRWKCLHRSEVYARKVLKDKIRRTVATKGPLNENWMGLPSSLSYGHKTGEKLELQ